MSSPRFWLVLLVCTSTVARAFVAFQIHSPLFYPDEYLYGALSRSIAHGSLAVRGSHLALSQTTSYLGPLLTAPAWRVFSVDTAYRASQLMGSLAFSLAAVPAYALARRAGVSPMGGLFVAVLALVVPSAMFTETLLAEPYAYPLFLATTLLALDALKRSRPRNWLMLTLACLALLFAGGLQFAPILPVVALAAVVSPAGRGQRRRAALSLATLIVVTATVLLSARDRYPVSAFMPSVHRFTAPPGSFLAWAGVNAFVVAVGAGWVSIPPALDAYGSMLRSRDRGERQFATLALLLSIALLVEATAWSTHGQGLYERFAFYVAVFAAIGVARVFERGLHRPLVFVVSAYALAALAVLVPLSDRLRAASDNAPTLRALDILGPGNGAVVWVPVLATLAAACALVRRVTALLPVAATVVCVILGAAIARDAVEQASHRVRPTAGSPSGTAILTASFEDQYTLMRALFWNPGIDRVLVLGGGAAPDGLPGTPVLLRADGRLESGGRAVDGPFAAGAGLLVLPGSIVGGAAPVAFRTPVEALVFGWFRGGYAAPYLLLVSAGGAGGIDLQLHLRSADHEQKRVDLACGGSRAGRYTIGHASRTLHVHVAPHRTSRCELRVIHGSVDGIHGNTVSLRGTLTVARAAAAATATARSKGDQPEVPIRPRLA